MKWSLPEDKPIYASPIQRTHVKYEPPQSEEKERGFFSEYEIRERNWVEDGRIDQFGYARPSDP